MVWSNKYYCDAVPPTVPGMCIRKAVAEQYLATVSYDALRRSLGHRGNELAGSEDFDMAMTAIDAGLVVGRFAQLRLPHLIASGRMTESYILKMAQESRATCFVVRAIHGRHPELNIAEFQHRVFRKAVDQEERFSRLGDEDAAAASRAFRCERELGQSSVPAETARVTSCEASWGLSRALDGPVTEPSGYGNSIPVRCEAERKTCRGTAS